MTNSLTNKYSRNYRMKHDIGRVRKVRNNVFKECEECGKLLMINQSLITKQNQQTFFCDAKCRDKFRSFGGNNIWKGGYIHGSGYVYVSRGESKRYLQHRAVMEEYLGRKLSKKEHVHHLNGIRSDNRLENLMVVNYLKHPTEKNKLIDKLQERIRNLEEICRKLRGN